MWPISLLSAELYIVLPLAAGTLDRTEPPPQVSRHLSFLHGIRALEERGSGAGKDEAGVSGSGGFASGEHKGSAVSRLDHGGRRDNGAEQAGGADRRQKCR